MHICLCFFNFACLPLVFKIKPPFAPVCQHRELDLNNCSKKISQKKKKRGKDYTTPYPKDITPLAERLAYARVPARLPPRRSPHASAARARAAARAPCPPPPRRSPPPARRRSARRRPPPRPHAINAAELTDRPPLPRSPPPTSPRPINRPPPHLRPSTSSPTAASAPAQPRSAAATPASASRRSLPWPSHLAAVAKPPRCLSA